MKINGIRGLSGRGQIETESMRGKIEMRKTILETVSKIPRNPFKRMFQKISKSDSGKERMVVKRGITGKILRQNIDSRNSKKGG